MARCTCHYEVGADTPYNSKRDYNLKFTRHTEPTCEVHGDRK